MFGKKEFCKIQLNNGFAAKKIYTPSIFMKKI